MTVSVDAGLCHQLEVGVVVDKPVRVHAGLGSLVECDGTDAVGRIDRLS